MNFRQLKEYLVYKLSEKYESRELQSLYFLLLEFYTNSSRTEVHLYPDKDFSVDEKQRILTAIDELFIEKPIQYIFGETFFFGNRFFVNEDVLIPRQETEELVAWILDETSENQQYNILDIGCGSGCISISIAKERPASKISALDISQKALSTAQKNAIENGVSVRFIHQDILQTDTLLHTYDIIVSNPPYVRNLEKQEMKQNVLGYEPHLALFVSDENPLIFYEKIADLAQKSLAPKGKLFFEINQYLGVETVNMLYAKGFSEVQLRNDLHGNPRMIKAML